MNFIENSVFFQEYISWEQIWLYLQHARHFLSRESETSRYFFLIDILKNYTVDKFSQSDKRFVNMKLYHFARYLVSKNISSYEWREIINRKYMILSSIFKLDITFES